MSSTQFVINQIIEKEKVKEQQNYANSFFPLFFVLQQIPELFESVFFMHSLTSLLHLFVLALTKHI